MDDKATLHQQLKRTLRGIDQAICDMRLSLAANPAEWTPDMRIKVCKVMETTRDELQWLFDYDPDE